jgi:hypothetical protein
MSIPVDLADLQAEISRIGASALLVTASSEGPPHVASVLVTFEGENLGMRAGRQTRSNASERPAVTLVWTAAVDPDYCLIVDAAVQDEPGDSFLVRPTSAVFHRLATAS